MHLVQLTLLTFTTLMVAITSNEVQASDKSPVRQVAIVTVSEQATIIRQLLGFVFSPQTQVLSSQVAGLVTSERLELGHRVSKGDILVQLDNREANASHALTKIEVKIAKIRVKRKQLIFDRINGTYTKGLSSIAEFDEAELALQQSKNEQKAYEAKSLLAKLNVGKHIIVAPFDAVLITHSPVVGKQLMPGENVVELLNDKQLRIKIDLSKPELQQLQRRSAQLVFPQRKHPPLSLLNFSPAILTNSGMLEAEFIMPMVSELPKSYTLNDEFYSGQAIKLQLIKNSMSVPEHAILKDNNGQYVLTVLNEKVVRVAINDLVVGQKVIVLGSSDLLSGDSVTVIPVGDFK